MIQIDQHELTQLMERYTALWNEADAGRRRQLIAELWGEDGTQFTPQHEYRGYPTLEERVTRAYDEFVQKNGFVFRLSTPTGPSPGCNVYLGNGTSGWGRGGSSWYGLLAAQR